MAFFCVKDSREIIIKVMIIISYLIGVASIIKRFHHCLISYLIRKYDFFVVEIIISFI